MCYMTIGPRLHLSLNHQSYNLGTETETVEKFGDYSCSQQSPEMLM